MASLPPRQRGLYDCEGGLIGVGEGYNGRIIRWIMKGWAGRNQRVSPSLCRKGSCCAPALLCSGGRRTADTSLTSPTVCCIYHKPKPFDESSDESDTDSDHSCASAGSADSREARRRPPHSHDHHGHSHDPSEGAGSAGDGGGLRERGQGSTTIVEQLPAAPVEEEEQRPQPNAYERGVGGGAGGGKGKGEPLAVVARVNAERRVDRELTFCSYVRQDEPTEGRGVLPPRLEHSGVGVECIQRDLSLLGSAAQRSCAKSDEAGLLSVSLSCLGDTLTVSGRDVMPPPS